MSRPDRVVWRGHVEAAGWIAADGATCRLRALRAWTPASQVRIGELRLVFLMPEAARVRRQDLPGEPLVRDARGGLLALPMAGGSPAVVLAAGGAALAVSMEALRDQRVADWLDLTGWQTAPCAPLGAQPGEPVVAVVAPPLAARELYGGAAPAPDPERDAVIEALKGRAPEAARAPVRSGGLERMLDRVLGWLRTASGGAGDQAGGSTSVLRPRGPGLLDRLQRWLSRSRLLGPLLSEIGRRQAKYMRDLVDAFEGGDLDAALRRALPLGGEKSADVVPSWGTPAYRTGALSPAELSASGGRGYAFSDSLYDRLRALYRDAAQRLEAQGEVDKAAFVLADLLQAPTEAVALLERHGRWALAARIAEGRGLPPERVVRQWILAGDAERALVVARRHDAFTAAIAALATTHPDKADALRLLHARLLAGRGDFAAAVRAIWPVQLARRAARAWLEQGIAAGGSGGAELMVWSVAELPGTFDAVAPGVAALLDDDSAAGLAARRAFRVALGAQPIGGRFPDALRPFAAVAVRSALRDEALLGHASDPTVSQLLEMARSPALGADLPNALRGTPSGLRGRGEPVVITVPAGDVGPSVVQDAVLLPGGALLVALGEAGVAVVGPTGKELWRCSEPAHRLVAPTSGDRVLLLARRGEALWRVASVDVHRRAARLHRDLALTAFAPQHGAGLWWVADGASLSALDPLDTDLRALWRNRDVGAPVTDIALGAEFVSWTTDTEEPGWFRLALGALQLRSRSAVPRADGDHPPRARPNDGLVWLRHGDGWELRVRAPDLTWPFDPGTATPRIGPVGAGSVVLLVDTAAILVDLEARDEVLRVTLRGATALGARLDTHLVVWDDRGRVVALDPETGATVRDVRL